jgi:hypothetical protein
MAPSQAHPPLSVVEQQLATVLEAVLTRPPSGVNSSMCSRNVHRVPLFAGRGRAQKILLQIELGWLWMTKDAATLLAIPAKNANLDALQSRQKLLH